MIRQTLTEREFCDLELLLDGSFAPLTGFMVQSDYESVLQRCRLANGEVWPIPIVLSMKEQNLPALLGTTVALQQLDGGIVAMLHVQSIWKPNLQQECLAVYGTTDTNHPGVAAVLGNAEEDVIVYVGGPVEAIDGGPRATRHDFNALRLSPQQCKALLLNDNGKKAVIGFQTRNPMHRCHMQLVINAIDQVRKEGGNDNKSVCALIHPAVGPTQDGDVHYATRVRCYQAIVPHEFPPEYAACVHLALIPLAMRMAGPREALWHALIRRNYGCTHFVMGRDPAGPSTRAQDGCKFYGDYDAHELVETFTEEELGIRIVKSNMLAYVPALERYLELPLENENLQTVHLSGTELRHRLSRGQSVPDWFSPASVVAILRSSGGGCCFYFTGLSGAGKSTLARALADRLKETIAEHKIVVLDGDEVRRNISAGLGFSRADRSRNVRRIGYVASLLVRAGSIVICANIAPYADDRAYNRALVEQCGGRYFEVHVDTPLDVCEKRDVKGLYQRARTGDIPQFTGISDPFETPIAPDLVLDTSKLQVEQCLQQLLSLLPR